MSIRGPHRIASPQVCHKICGNVTRLHHNDQPNHIPRRAHHALALAARLHSKAMTVAPVMASRQRIQPPLSGTWLASAFYSFGSACVRLRMLSCSQLQRGNSATPLFVRSSQCHPHSHFPRTSPKLPPALRRWLICGTSKRSTPKRRCDFGSHAQVAHGAAHARRSCAPQSAHFGGGLWLPAVRCPGVHETTSFLEEVGPLIGQFGFVPSACQRRLRQPHGRSWFDQRPSRGTWSGNRAS